MKTPTHILALLFFVLPLLSKAQQDSIVLNNEALTHKNQIDLDMHVFGGEINYRYNLSSSLSIGGAFYIGFSPIFVMERIKNEQFYDPINNVTYGSDKVLYRGNTYLEKLSAKILISKKVSKKMNVHVAFKTMLFHDEVLSTTNYNAIEFGIFYRIKKIELGLKPSIGNNEGRFLMGIPLFLIRVNIAKW